MNEQKKDDGAEELDVLKGKDENAHFDMYHFFKRRDVIAVAILLIVLLLVTFYFMLAVPQTT